MKYLTIILLSLLLLGCGKEIVYRDRTVEVKVPVQVLPPEPPDLVCQALPIDYLTTADKGDYAKIAKAYAVSVEILKSCLEDHKLALEKYKRK